MNMQHKKPVPLFTYRYLWGIGIVTILLGTILALLPSLVGHLFFNNGDGSINFFVRMLGSTLVGYGVMNLLAVRTKSFEACSIAVWANLATLLIATVVSLSYLSTYTDYGWLVIGQHLLFTSGFIYSAVELSKAKTQHRY